MYMYYQLFANVILLFLKVFKPKQFHETELNFSIVTEKKNSVQFVSNIVIWARRWNKHVMTIWPKLEGIFFPRIDDRMYTDKIFCQYVLS